MKPTCAAPRRLVAKYTAGRVSSVQDRNGNGVLGDVQAALVVVGVLRLVALGVPSGGPLADRVVLHLGVRAVRQVRLGHTVVAVVVVRRGERWRAAIGSASDGLPELVAVAVVGVARRDVQRVRLAGEIALRIITNLSRSPSKAA